VIPQILTITDESAADAIVMQFALQNRIETSQIFDIQPEKDELTVDQIHLLQKDIQISFTRNFFSISFFFYFFIFYFITFPFLFFCQSIW
jgi:hypothetical protein